MSVAGVTSTGSKRPDALFGLSADGTPQRMKSSHGCIVRATDGRDYLDFIMGLGAVALGYGHPAVNEAVIDAVQRGTAGSLAPEDEEALATELSAAIPWIEGVRFLKTGAEAVAAAVRIARVATGRERVIGCGYHGWHDWCSRASGVPAPITSLFEAIPFNDSERARERIRAAGNALACVVLEPVIDAGPDAEWLQVVQAETAHVGAVLIFDEIKTGFRLAIGGAAERWNVRPDLVVLGKALANGYPLALVGGRSSLMKCVTRTWISSTAATEFVSLAAARATLRVMQTENVPHHLAARGEQLLRALHRLARTHARLGVRAAGLPEMCYLRYEDDALSQRIAAECARHGLLFKRNAYNFVSLAHTEASVDQAVDILDQVLAAC